MASALVALAVFTFLRWQKLSVMRLLHFLTCTAPAAGTSVALERAGVSETREEDIAQPYTLLESTWMVQVSATWPQCLGFPCSQGQARQRRTAATG